LSTCTDRTCLSFRETVVSDSPLSQLLSPRLRTSPPSACALPHTTPPVSSLSPRLPLYAWAFDSLQSVGLCSRSSLNTGPSTLVGLWLSRVSVCLGGPPHPCPFPKALTLTSSLDLSSPHPRCPPLSVHSPHLRTLSELGLHPPIVTHHLSVVASPSCLPFRCVGVPPHPCPFPKALTLLLGSELSSSSFVLTPHTCARFQNSLGHLCLAVTSNDTENPCLAPPSRRRLPAPTDFTL